MISVKDVMTREVITFREDTPVDQIAQTLTGKHITGAPVVDDNNNVIGIVSEMDVIGKRGETARDIMSRNVISVTEDTGLDEAARLLVGERIRRLPVTSRGRMVGLISRSDVLEVFAHSHWTCATCGNQQRGIERPDRCSQCGGQRFFLEHADPGP
jgi:CBS domain-containing protein/DNA-directed RNA polymerase subunit RPC12/RpoP